MPQKINKLKLKPYEPIHSKGKQGLDLTANTVRTRTRLFETNTINLMVLATVISELSKVQDKQPYNIYIKKETFMVKHCKHR